MSSAGMRRVRNAEQSGFTLIELMVVVALVALLASFAIPAYNGYIDDAKESQAIGDIGRIAMAIERYRMNNDDQLPPSLGDLPIDNVRDPWGKWYLYTDLTDPANAGKFRKSAGGDQLNTDYDLLSRGPDGKSSRKITNDNAVDDIIRLKDGAYVGLVEEF